MTHELKREPPLHPPPLPVSPVSPVAPLQLFLAPWLLMVFVLGCHQIQRVDEQPVQVRRPCSHDDDNQCGDKQLCFGDRCGDITSDLTECSVARLLFEPGSATLREEDTPVVRRMAHCLKAGRGVSVFLDGGKDTASSAALALGDRRAQAVSQSLQGMGVSTDELRNANFGAASASHAHPL